MAGPKNMWLYLVCAAIWIGFILPWLISSIRKRRTYSIYAECGIGLCLTLVIFGLFGWYENPKEIVVYQILQAIGNVLLFAAIAMAVFTLITLKTEGKPRKGIEETRFLVKGTVFGVIRHPLYLALTLWAVSQALAIQSIFSLILGGVAIFCFWMASKKEDEYNLKKFGNSYREYMEKVPMWNVLKVLGKKTQDEKHK